MKKYATIEEAIQDAEDSLQESLKIARTMIENIPDKSIWRDLGIVTTKAFGLLFDTILEFAKPDDDSWKTKRFEDKAKIIGELKILNDIYERDFNMLNKIRVHLAHSMEIDENLIKGILHNTHTYKFNKTEMDKKTLQEQYHTVALKALYILRHHHGQFVTSYLNKLGGWEGSNYKFD